MAEYCPFVCMSSGKQPRISSSLSTDAAAAAAPAAAQNSRPDSSNNTKNSNNKMALSSSKEKLAMKSWSEFWGWMNGQLEDWGLDSALYARCILSILRQPAQFFFNEDSDGSDEDVELFPTVMNNGGGTAGVHHSLSLSSSVGSTSAAASGGGGSNTNSNNNNNSKKNADESDSDEPRRAALVECLNTAEVAKAEVEEFVGSMLERFGETEVLFTALNGSSSSQLDGLQRINNNMNRERRSPNGVYNPAGLIVKPNESIDSGVCPSPEESFQNYDEAFPPLNDFSSELVMMMGEMDGDWGKGLSSREDDNDVRLCPPPPLPITPSRRGYHQQHSPLSSTTPSTPNNNNANMASRETLTAATTTTTGPLNINNPNSTTPPYHHPSIHRQIHRRFLSGDSQSLGGRLSGGLPFTTEWSRPKSRSASAQHIPANSSNKKLSGKTTVTGGDGDSCINNVGGVCGSVSSSKSNFFFKASPPHFVVPRVKSSTGSAKVGSCPTKLEYGYSGPPGRSMHTEADLLSWLTAQSHKCYTPTPPPQSIPPPTLASSSAVTTATTIISGTTHYHPPPQMNDPTTMMTVGPDGGGDSTIPMMMNGCFDGGGLVETGIMCGSGSGGGGNGMTFDAPKFILHIINEDENGNHPCHQTSAADEAPRLQQLQTMVPPGQQPQPAAAPMIYPAQSNPDKISENAWQSIMLNPIHHQTNQTSASSSHHNQGGDPWSDSLYSLGLTNSSGMFDGGVTGGMVGGSDGECCDGIVGDGIQHHTVGEVGCSPPGFVVPKLADMAGTDNIVRIATVHHPIFNERTHFLPIKSDSMESAFVPKPRKHTDGPYALDLYGDEEYYIFRDGRILTRQNSIDVLSMTGAAGGADGGERQRRRSRGTLPLKFKAGKPEKEIQTDEALPVLQQQQTQLLTAENENQNNKWQIWNWDGLAAAAVNKDHAQNNTANNKNNNNSKTNEELIESMVRRPSKNKDMLPFLGQLPSSCVNQNGNKIVNLAAGSSIWEQMPVTGVSEWITSTSTTDSCTTNNPSTSSAQQQQSPFHITSPRHPPPPPSSSTSSSSTTPMKQRDITTTAGDEIIVTMSSSRDSRHQLQLLGNEMGQSNLGHSDDLMNNIKKKTEQCVAPPVNDDPLILQHQHQHGENAIAGVPLRSATGELESSKPPTANTVEEDADDDLLLSYVGNISLIKPLIQA